MGPLIGGRSFDQQHWNFNWRVLIFYLDPRELNQAKANGYGATLTTSLLSLYETNVINST